MRKTFIALALGALFAMPCVLRAEEVEIQLMEVVNVGFIPGNNPLDDPGKEGTVPTRPASFRAAIDGTILSINKQEVSIPSAQAIVVNAATGSVVLNQPFTTSISEQITAPGVYVLRISTANGDLVGQFMVD